MEHAFSIPLSSKTRSLPLHLTETRSSLSTCCVRTRGNRLRFRERERVVPNYGSQGSQSSHVGRGESVRPRYRGPLSRPFFPAGGSSGSLAFLRSGRVDNSLEDRRARSRDARSLARARSRDREIVFGGPGKEKKKRKVRAAAAGAATCRVTRHLSRPGEMPIRARV